MITSACRGGVGAKCNGTQKHLFSKRTFQYELALVLNLLSILILSQDSRPRTPVLARMLATSPFTLPLSPSLHLTFHSSCLVISQEWEMVWDVGGVCVCGGVVFEHVWRATALSNYNWQ